MEEVTPRRTTIEEGELIEILKEKVTRVASKLKPNVKYDLITYLRRNADVFAKDVHDLTRINSGIIVHRLIIIRGATWSSRGSDTLSPRRTK